jgi:hypothetical protein
MWCGAALHERLILTPPMQASQSPHRMSAERDGRKPLFGQATKPFRLA